MEKKIEYRNLAEMFMTYIGNPVPPVMPRQDYEAERELTKLAFILGQENGKKISEKRI